MKKITIENYLMGRVDFMTLPSDQQTSILKLLQQVNDLLAEFGQERVVSSGYRTMEDHLRIYKEKNEKRKAQGLPELKVPMGSNHLKGAAVDLRDPDEKLEKFCTEAILKKYNLYKEAGSATIGWTHLQCVAPKSGKREFNP